MADIKTHLRELSVATTIGLFKERIHFTVDDLYNSEKFYNYAFKLIDGDISGASNILSEPLYINELQEIINNGYKLGKKIFESDYFKIYEGDTIQWLGNDTQKGDPIDIYVGSYGFSLKEESFILKNMGFYELLNCLTGSNYHRGLHIFEKFAPAEYDAWFAYTWENFVNYLKEQDIWTLKKGFNISECKLEGDNVILKFNGRTCIVPVDITTNCEYMDYTSAIIREKTFSKWINNEFQKDKKYIILKKACSKKAGQAVCNLITKNYSPDHIYRFFQIYDTEYYYAKTTHFETTVLKVPSRASFPSVIKLDKCHFEAPTSQLNIYSTFVNTQTYNQLVFRNECRFSHGQFNGTPEAKMYVAKNTSLTDLYEPIL